MLRVNALILCIVAAMAIGCKHEEIISEEFDPSILNGPIGITIVPSANVALVSSSNYRLDYASGALSVIDLNTNAIIADLTLEIPNFAGEILVDETRGRIVIPNRFYDSVSVYDYTVPGVGQPIEINEANLSNAMEGTTNQIEVEDDPFGISLAEPVGIDPKIYVGNIKTGDVTSLMASDLTVNEAENEDKNSVAIPLIALPSLGKNKDNDGVGVNRMALSSDSRLVFLTSSSSNYIFIIDTFDDKVEGVIDVTEISPASVGMRGIKITSDDRLFVAHRGLGGIIVLDVSGVRDNGINNEIIKGNYITFIPTGKDPEGIAFDSAESKLYVCNEGESSLTVIDASNYSILKMIDVERGPTEIAVHPTNDMIYVTNFFSNSVSVVDTTTDTVTGVIK